ncbi:hypothetical protein [Paractinoplanes hotanensis]|uniref:Uncharacterized protein n=1 Tax=Paractinoplanes hotanensis TaxID=2906497 RepID=A0ABT0YEA8_9ACTN|nr:hypothetical protein [Actinoplanes hotanensis]MCM4083584.1 hypothetical protein [Actinoplanes hotanensis]
MAADLTSPSIEGAAYLGLFDKYDKDHHLPESGESWSMSVLAKMWKDNMDQGGSAQTNRLLASNYPPDQWEAWMWFQDQTKPETWKGYVEDKREGMTDPPPPFDPNESYIDRPSSGFNELPVKPYDAKSGGKGGVTVSTEALQHFANTLKAIVPAGGGILMESKTAVDAVDPRPGGFAVAQVTRNLIVDDAGGGLKEDVKVVLDRLQELLYEVAEEVSKIAKDYDTAEELNSLSVQTFKELTGRSDARLGVLGDSGTNSEAVAGN